MRWKAVNTVIFIALSISLTAAATFAAPTVTVQTPTANATWVPEYAPFSATFSEAMDPASLSSDSFALEKRVGLVAIAAGLGHSVGLRGDGTVAAWGSNTFGETNVPPGLVNVVAVAAGGSHSVALRGDGGVVAWGYNSAGQASVPAGLANVVAIAAGGSHTVALRGDGSVLAWGYNAYGQTTVPVGATNVVAIAAGGYHTVALKADGSVIVWGLNSYGQKLVPAGLANVVAIAAGGDHTVALQGDGTVVAWGRNDYGQTLVPAGLTGVVAVAAGANHSVALRDDGTVVMWGQNATVPATLAGVLAVAAGSAHTLALKENGVVVAWGLNDYGQSTVPTGYSVVAIANGGGHSVALKADGTMLAWGLNNYRQATLPSNLTGVTAIAAGTNHSVAVKGDGTVVAWGDNSLKQASVPAGLTGVVAVAAGKWHTLALKGDGTVVGWGHNGFGQTSVPADLVGVTAIAAGPYHSVALKSDGTVAAWGYNNKGQTTVPADLVGVVAIAAGETHTVALRGDSTLAVWGKWANVDKYEPLPTNTPDGFSGVSAIAAGRYRTMAVMADGSVVVWGGPAVPEGLTGVVAVTDLLALKGDGTVVDLSGSSPVPANLSAYAQRVAGTHSYNTDTRTATFTPDAALEPESVYQTKVFGRSAAGVPMAGASTWRFSTGETLATFLARPVSGGNGRFSPAIGSLVMGGATTSFTLTPEPGYLIDSVTGCNGSLVGDLYTTAPMTAGCTITARFLPIDLPSPPWLDVPATNADGYYTVTWGATNASEVIYVLQEATAPDFTSGLRTVYTGSERVATIAAQNNGTYYYRVKATRAGYVDSPWLSGPGGCAVDVTCASPPSISAPAADTDGSYTVTWTASATPGVTYVLQEATDAAFSAGLRTVSTGSELAAAITGRSQSLTYYYRVKATKAGANDSGYNAAFFGCAVPGTGSVVKPASLTLPTADADGSYTVAWPASTTTGVTYMLQETIDPSFMTGFSTIYIGPALAVEVSGRSPNRTYYYRVKAMKAGFRDSGYQFGTFGCAVPGSAGVGGPPSITVASADADGAYPVSWGASATPGVVYLLQEAINPTFTAGLRYAYYGTGLSTEITGRSQNLTYYYRVKAVKAGAKDSGYRFAAAGCAIPGTGTAAAPASLTVPVADLDGAFAVSWGASSTPGASYLLQEASDPAFTVGLRTVYAGSALSSAITGRSQNGTYFYRVRAFKAGLTDSDYRSAENGCAVPGTYPTVPPGSLIVPASDPDGAYTVNWGASSMADVTYLLQEATDATFTLGLRTVYSGPALTAAISGRSHNTTYFYRIRAIKGGFMDSPWLTDPAGCLIGP